MRYVVGISLFIVLCAFGYYGVTNKMAPGAADYKTYTNSRFGFSFRYPANYVLQDIEVGDAHREHSAIILTEDTETNRRLRAGKMPDTDGPTAITLDIYQNNLDKLTPIEWIMGMNDSNFKLSDGTYATTTLAGIPAITYQSTGLYEAKNYVFSGNDRIYKLSVTWMTTTDQILKDFDFVKNSFTFP